MHRYIARENPAAARREIARIKKFIKLFASSRVEGREVTLEGGEKVRFWLISSYRVYYRRLGNAVQVIRVYHQARRPIEQ